MPASRVRGESDLEAGVPSVVTAAERPTLSVSVTIPAYTMERWELLCESVESVRAQTVAAEQVVVCIDNNEELLRRAEREWADCSDPAVVVIPNRHSEHLDHLAAHGLAHGTSRRFGAGPARSAAAELVHSDVIAFIDDDARAEPDWLAQLLSVFESPSIVAVGGAPLPVYETGRPRWYPDNFDWVFGCAYQGLPSSAAPLRHLIGANLAVRRYAWEAVGGFMDSDFDDLDLCLRLAQRFGSESLYYAPDAVVHHFVPAERVTWRYFYRRCYFVNRGKVKVFRSLGGAANLMAEREFVLRALTTQVGEYLRRAAKGQPDALRQLAAMMAGIALAVLGHVRGRMDRVTQRDA